MEFLEVPHNIFSLLKLESLIELDISSQPDDTTCGPTCLHAIYKFYDDDIPLQQVIDEVLNLKGGGTLGSALGFHALQRGYKATIYTYNLNLFDPTWFQGRVDIVEKLKSQLKYKDSPKFRFATESYINFLELGGMLKCEDLKPSLLRKFLKKATPIIAGLSATYLYGLAREYGPKDDHDDLRGYPAGHFVVLNGYEEKKIMISDPLMDNPYSRDQQYKVSFEKLICSVLLGILTYDGKLLIIEP